ncbi:Coiled-coil domain-containing protein 18 [Oryzias melastigma]|uniref:Coiled-coil domain-containing protein 18 n=1 Tax=Oryzias melastigma TaxID=30732 RepID=A0A834C8M5_ORYME|nr:Coiled-coil domain-containing protein 18 [Oryzias melastigma]
MSAFPQGTINREEEMRILVLHETEELHNTIPPTTDFHDPELSSSWWHLCNFWIGCWFEHSKTSADQGTGFRLSGFTASDMSKCHSELTQQEQELLKIRRDSDTKATELAKMERMLQQTKSLMDKKTESGSDSMGFQENLVEDLEEKVRSSRRYRRNSLHHTQMLESQMKTVKGELVGTLDHLQELRNVLRRSQQKAEERKAAMEKLAAGLR